MYFRRILKTATLVLSISTMSVGQNPVSSLTGAETRGFEYKYTVGYPDMQGFNGYFDDESTLYFIQIDSSEVIYIKHPHEELLPSIIINFNYATATLTNTALYWNLRLYSVMKDTLSRPEIEYDGLILNHCDSISDRIYCDSITIRTADGSKDSIKIVLLDAKIDNIPIVGLHYPYIKYLPKIIIRQNSTTVFTRELEDQLEIRSILKRYEIPENFDELDVDDVNMQIWLKFGQSPEEVIERTLDQIKNNKGNK